MGASDLSSATIGQLAVRVQDLDRAVGFYRDVLGLPLLFQAPPGLAFFKAGGVRLMLSKPETAAFDHPGAIVYYTVTDIAATHKTLADRGVLFIETPKVIHRTPASELWMAFFEDSEGNPIAIMHDKPIAAS
jgi:methylmalonyl-CoA/ethylmalonyl-CoA epimerase